MMVETAVDDCGYVGVIKEMHLTVQSWNEDFHEKWSKSEIQQA